MDSSAGDANVTTAEEYVFGHTADWRTDLYQFGCPRVPTHKESIALIGSGGGYFTPELKSASVEMPFNGTYSQEDYAQQMIDEYIEAGIPPSQVWPQSFNHEDVFYWIENTEYGQQAVALDDNYESTNGEIDILLETLVSRNVAIVAPPMQRLVEPNAESPYRMKPSYYANATKARGLDVITWTLERSGPGLSGFYWSSLEGQVELNQGDRYNLLYVLSMDVGILGMFSDWPATTTFFANCMGLSLRPASLTNTPVGDEEENGGDTAVDGDNESGGNSGPSMASILALMTLAGLQCFCVF